MDDYIICVYVGRHLLIVAIHSPIVDHSDFIQYDKLGLKSNLITHVTIMGENTGYGFLIKMNHIHTIVVVISIN